MFRSVIPEARTDPPRAVLQRREIRARFRRILVNYELYLFILPAFLYFIIFHYWPMYGVQIAFKDFTAALGIEASPWVGLKHFERFVRTPSFATLIVNTVGISLYQLAVAFPFPILLALLMNEMRFARFKKLLQTMTYAPHFISTVVLVSMLIIFLNPEYGLINSFLRLFGLEPVYFMVKNEWFKTIYVFSGVWQNAGWASIIYLAVLAGIDPERHEAAMLDGASRLQRIWYVNIPGLMPTIVILFILEVGGIMSVGFEKVFLLQNPLNLEASEVISTYVYKVGLLNFQYSFSAAVGLFNSVINFILLISVNSLVKRLGQANLW